MVQLVILLPSGYNGSKLSNEDKRRMAGMQALMQADDNIMRTNIEIHGLVNRPDLNKCVGTAVGGGQFMGPNTRAEVILTMMSGLRKGSERSISIKAKNVKSSNFFSVVVCDDVGTLEHFYNRNDILIWFWPEQYGGQAEQDRHAARTFAGLNMISLFPGGPSVDRDTHHTFWEGAVVYTTLPPVDTMLMVSLDPEASNEQAAKFRTMVSDLASKMANATTSAGGAAGGAGGSQA